MAIAAGFVAVATLLPTPLQAADQTQDEIRVVKISGVVEVSPSGANAWVLTQTNQLLHPADRLRTGPSSTATLKWSDQSTMSLAPLTEMKILSHPVNEEPGLHLWQGILSFFHRDKPGRIRIITQGVTAGIDGTEFVLEESGNGAAERTILSVIDGQVRLTNAIAAVTVTNGIQAISMPGRAPVLTRGFIANNLMQWCFYYPAVLDLRDLPLTQDETAALAVSLAAYRDGDVAGALAKYPANIAAPSDNMAVYHAALLLGVGDASGAEEIIEKLSGAAESRRAERLGRALRLLIAAVKRQTIPAGVVPELPTELLAASYYEQSRGAGDQSLNAALGLARKAAALSPDFSFAWERVAELEFGFGRTGAARAALRKSLALAPRNAQAVALEGFLSSAQNRMTEALAAFNRAISLDSALANAWLGRGLCRIKLGQDRAGREDLLIAAALEPQRAVLRSYLGKAFADGGDDARAARELVLARNLDTNDPTAWLYLALLRQQQNKINPAISDLQTGQANNDNRSVFRSRFLLDKDFAVASANLASFYRDAGMTDVSVREAARAVTSDYANASAHLFLADSFYNLLDPTQITLRYDTVQFNELLLANTLAPVGAGRLSQQVSQQDYSKLFAVDGLGLAGTSDARTDGMFHQTASQYGTFGNTSYAVDLDYHHNNGVRVNNSIDNIFLDSVLKQQFTPRDTGMLLVQYENYHSGDNFQYFDQTNARPFYKFNEQQQPELVGTWHHEWGPGIHTLFLLDRLVNNQAISDKASPQLLLVQAPRGPVTASIAAPLDVNYNDEFEVYGAELSQICQWDRVSLVGGARYQSGQFQAQNQFGNPTPADAVFFTTLGAASPLTYTGSTTSLFQRETAYGYLTVEPVRHLLLTGGMAAEQETFPYYFRNPPIRPGDNRRSQLDPKAAFVWSPRSEVTWRGVYTRSLGGVSIDESYRLEPTELAGFPQAFRSLISESLAGSQSAPSFETLGTALDLKLASRTYLGFQVERLASQVDEGVGDFLLQNGSIPAVVSATPRELRYAEHTGSVSLNQLIGADFDCGLAYKITESDLHQSFPGIPLASLQQSFHSTLQEVDGYFLFNHSSGFFARFDAHWYGQNNNGWTPAEPNSSFFQENIYGGYRFAHRRAELQLGILNLAGGGYNLNPLTPYLELPRKRVLEARFNLIF